MAKPKSSSKQLCWGCGDSFSPRFFAPQNPKHVCNACVVAFDGQYPDPLPFDPTPKAPLAPQPVKSDLDDVYLPVDNVALLETAERVLIRRSLLTFVQRFKTNYVAGWVHEDICRRLERFVKDVEDGKMPRLLLCMPPRHGKSELTSRKFPAWAMGLHPDWEIIAASHTQSLALSFSRHIRDLMRDPAYNAVFPEALLDPDSQAVENWNTTASGGYLAAGVGTGITGRGAHILIIDDPVKDMESADSATIRDNIWEWYTSTAYTRLAPGGGVLGIMTLWNEDDWGGRIIEVSDSGDGDKFEIVRYPAINEGYAEYLAADERTIVHVTKDEEPPAGATLLRAPDQALHEARYNLTALRAIKKNYYARGNQRVWSALYQQRPTPEDGVYFTKNLMRYYSTAPHRRHRTIYQAWDFAITEETTSDYTVCATILQDENDALYVIDIDRFRSDDSIEIVDRILDNYAQFDADMIGFEDGQIWKTMQAQFTKRCHERKLYPNHELLKPLTDKLVRAMPLRGRMQLGKVYFPEKAPWKEECVKELLTFPAGKHEDQVDAIAWAVRLTLGHSAPKIPQPKELKSWRDKLKTVGMHDVSHMAA